MQRGLDFRVITQQCSDLAQLAIHTGSRHQSVSAPINDGGAFVCHVKAVAQGSVDCGNGGDLFFYGNRFAGECRLVYLEPRRFDDAQIGRHHVTGFQQHHVAWDKFSGSDGFDTSVAHHARAYRSHLFKRGHCALRPVFLDESDHCIQDHDDDDRKGVFHIADNAGNDCRDNQHDDHEIGKLFEQHAPR